MGTFNTNPAEDQEETEGALQLVQNVQSLNRTLSAEKRKVRVNKGDEQESQLKKNLNASVKSKERPFMFTMLVDSLLKDKLNRGFERVPNFDQLVLPTCKHNMSWRMLEVRNRDGKCESWSAKPIMCYNAKERAHSHEKVHNQSVPQDSDTSKNDDAYECSCEWLLYWMIDQDLLFLAGEHAANFDDDVDDLALNVDHVFEADQCDAFDSDYVEDNEEHVVQSNVSSVRNDALMSILDEMHEQGVQSRSANKQVKVVNDTLTSELARYKELVGVYEQRAKFELTDRERKIDEQMRIIISDRNRKETSLKSELHSAQLQLRSTLNHHKIVREEAIILKKDFKQKEDKFLEEFLDIKRLKEKVEDRLYKQDQSVQTVHMICKPKSFYDEKNKVAIGYKNPLCLTRAKLASTTKTLYNGHVLVMSNHARPVVHDSEDTRDMAEITRKRMMEKMQSPQCVENKNICRVQTALFKEVKVMEEIFDQMSDEVDQNVVDKQCAEIVKKNLLIENENLIANCLSNQLLFDVEKSRCPRNLKLSILKAEIEKVKQHYKEMFESIKITHASTNEKTSSLLTHIENLKAQLEGNLKVTTRSSVKTKVLAPGMYAIDVEPIPPHPKNNRSAHLNYINHLKESVETVREIVEEAKVVKPLDNALNYACQYTKLSQELVEYVIDTCPKSFNERDNKAPSTPLIRRKQVTFNDTCRMSINDTQKQVRPHKVHQSNVTVIPSTRVSSSTRASESKPRSNTKHDRILPAKSVNKKKVEDQPRTDKSVWTKVNRVDSSISCKRVVINSNYESVCKTCNKCLNSANHEMCVVNILSSVNATPTVKTVLNKGKQTWKPKAKLSDNSLNKTKRVWKATWKLLANVGYQWRPTGKKFTLGKLDCGYQWRPTGKKFALGDLCPFTRLPVTCTTTISSNQQDPNVNWGSEIPNSPNSTVFKCRWYRSSQVSGLRLFKTYDRESFKAQELCEKV
ncbi:hypothetical protein Tco_0957652, partial [Tanacetum coccineum]